MNNVLNSLKLILHPFFTAKFSIRPHCFDSHSFSRLRLVGRTTAQQHGPVCDKARTGGDEEGGQVCCREGI